MGVSFGITAWAPNAPIERFSMVAIEACNIAVRLITGLPRWTRVKALYFVVRCPAIQNLYSIKCGIATCLELKITWPWID